MMLDTKHWLAGQPCHQVAYAGYAFKVRRASLCQPKNLCNSTRERKNAHTRFKMSENDFSATARLGPMGRLEYPIPMPASKYVA